MFRVNSGQINNKRTLGSVTANVKFYSKLLREPTFDKVVLTLNLALTAAVIFVGVLSVGSQNQHEVCISIMLASYTLTFMKSILQFLWLPYEASVSRICLF